MPSRLISWFNSKSRKLLKKTGKPKSWTKRIISKLPYRQKELAKDEWKKANQPTIVVVEVSEVDHDNYLKESCALHRSTLITACCSGDTEKVKSLLEEDVDINEQDEEGTTALILACLGGHTEIIEMLLKKDAQADVQRNDGKTALMCSSQVEVVKLLLEHSAQISLQDKEGWTALMKAADNGLTEVVQLLLEHRAQVDTQSEWGKTALMLASHKRHVEVVEVLLKHNVEIDLQDYQGWTALMLASKEGHSEVAKLLLQQGAKVDLRTDAGTALMWASEEGHEEVAKLLLEHGAQVNLCSDIGETALMWACDAGRSEVAKLLLEYGAQVDLRTKRSEETALLRASKKGHSEVVKLLLEHCAQADLQTEKGETALMCASEKGHYEVARLLLEHGTQVDLHNSEGETALMLASSKGHTEVVKLLVEHGAQVYMKDKYGFSILMSACRQGRTDVVKFLLAQGCNAQINEPNYSSRWETVLMSASKEGHFDVVKVLLNHGAQVNLQDYDDRTALILASSNGHTEVVKLLLQNGAQITLQDKYGWSALMHACSQNQTDLVLLLLDRGCGVQINQPDNFGKTTLMCASEKGHYEVAKVLLAHGAQVDMQVNNGKTALMHASKGGHCEVVKLLLEHHAHVNLQADTGKTALMCAAKRGHSEVAEQLLKNCAEVDLETKMERSEINLGGITALMLSIKHHAFAEMLMEHGAQVNKRLICKFIEKDRNVLSLSEYDSLHSEVKAEGVTFLMRLMFERSSQDSIKFLLEHGAEVDLKAKLFTVIIAYRKTSKMESLRGTEVDRQTMEIDGVTALMCAAFSDKQDGYAAALLLEHGAQIDSQTKGDVDGLTALMVAAMSGNEEVADVLLKHGAQVDLKVKGNAYFSGDFYDEVKIVLPENSSLAYFQTKHEFEGVTALMCAILFNCDNIALSLLKHGAQINIQAKGVMKGKTALILALITENYDVAKVLLEYGADVDLQDDHGWSPLMYAVQTENLEAFQLLIAQGANIYLKTNEGKTIHDICSPDLKKDPRYIKALLMSINKSLDMDSDYPGVMFSNQSLKETLTLRETTIGQLCDGLSVYIPTHALSSEGETLELSIRPCFNGPFELPAEYKPVSPAYLIRHSKTRFQKDITIRMHHYANLESEKDCEDMSFFTASSTPKYRKSQPVYIFKEIPGARGVFKPGDQVGEISLQHFCLLITGKRKRENDSEDSSESPESSSKRHQDGDLYYSARLYRSAEHDRTVSAVFCMCLCHPIYIKHCDTVISKRYTGERSVDFVRVHEDSITIYSNDSSGQHVIFDKVPAQIRKRDVDLPESLNIELLDYPPRLLISVKTSKDFTSPVIQVHGLDKECGYSLLPISTPSITPAPSTTLQSFQHKDAGSVDFIVDTESSTLDIDDLSDVLDEVKTLSSKWRLLLTKLGVKQSTLDSVESNNIKDVDMCLCAALGEWLRLNYDHRRHGRPCWRKLVKAVCDIDFALSETIRLSKRHSSKWGVY